MPSLFRRALLLAALLPLATTTACAFQVSESSLIRPVAAGPLSAEALAQAAPGLSLEPHTIIAPDGARLSAVLLRRPGAKITILYFGGNQFTVGRLGPAAARMLAPLDANLMLVDHRGYGQSLGVPNAGNLLTDGVAVFDHLARLPEVDPGKIVVHGQSLGSLVAGHVAAARPMAGVVLESSITTTEQWVRSQSRGMPVQISPALAGLGNQRSIGRIDEPLLILVGAADATTPPSLSEALYRLSPLPADRKTLAVIEGAGHNGVLMQQAGQEAYRAFLGRVAAVAR